MRRAPPLALILLAFPLWALAQQPPAPSIGPEDRRVAGELAAVFTQVPAFRGIAVDVRAGVVTLSGEAASASVRATAERLAARPGVIFVHNTLTLAESEKAPAEEPAKTTQDEVIQQQLEAIFARVPSLAGVKATAKFGVVSLTGEADSAEARKKAEELAQSMKGAVYVDNRITETQDVSQKLAPSLNRLEELGRRTWNRLPITGIAFSIALLFWLLAKLVRRIGFGFKKNKLLQRLVQQTAGGVVVLIGVFIALDLLEATALVGAALGTAGVVGLALGFAFRDIVENFLMSVLLSIRQPFEPDDFVEINGMQGTIISLTTSETVLMTPDGNHLRLPNSVVFKSTLINFTRNPLRRLDFKVGVGVHEDLTRAQELGLAVLREMPGVIDEPPPTAFVDALRDCDVALQFLGWVDQSKSSFVKVKSQAMRLIKERFDAEDVEMPAPAQTIQMLALDPAEVKAAIAEKMKRRAPTKSEVESIDVSVSDELKAQLEVERAASEAENLLSSEAAPGS